MKLKYLLPLWCIILLSSCAVEPIAFFSVPTTAAPGDTIQPTNYSVDADSYLWDFGDGSTATEASAKHIYTTTGNYNITLTAFSKNKKKSDVATKNIVIDGTQKFLGGYNVTENCGGSPATYFMNIFSSSTNQVFISNITTWGLSVTANISSNNGFTIPSQDMGGGTTLQGTGIMVNNVLTINYTLNSGGIITSCTATCVKQ